MKRVRISILGLAAVIAVALVQAPASAVLVGVDQSTAPWVGFMNVFELDGTSGVFSSGWGVPDLVAEFDDPGQTLTLLPNQIGDPDPFWYIGGGGPGAPGNKVMEANLFQQVDDGSFSGTTVTFEGNVISNTMTAAHTTIAFIRDFAPDFSSFTETTAPLTPGAFSISHVTDPDPARHVQYGFQVKGVNVWETDIAPFGSVVIASVPEPSAFLFGSLLCGVLGMKRSRKRQRC